MAVDQIVPDPKGEHLERVKNCQRILSLHHLLEMSLSNENKHGLRAVSTNRVSNYFFRTSTHTKPHRSDTRFLSDSGSGGNSKNFFGLSAQIRKEL